MLVPNTFLRRSAWRKISKQTIKRERKWKSVIGLEVHAQIISETKLFSDGGTKFGAPPNTMVSLFDAAIPGSLPVLNRKCVESGILTALALGCKVNEVSLFDRKHYFYADMPAGYQITQQRAPLANNGILRYPVLTPGKKIYYKSVRLQQLQLEQDSGKSIYDDVLNRRLIDLNRAGLPLMELVFAPDIENSEEAASLVKELILILRCIKTCSCKMEEGALRVDANVSVHKEGDPLGVRTEIKNIGSVRGISQAISFEISRQKDVILNGGTVVNETRAWDAEMKVTVPLRDKEVLQDYRYMPEPNLPPLHLEMKNLESNFLCSVPKLLSHLPELPSQTREKLMEEYKFLPETAAILVNETRLLKYFVNIMKNLPKSSAKLVSNFLINDFLTFLKKAKINIEDCEFSEIKLLEIIRRLYDGQINLETARQILNMIEHDPESTVAKLIKNNDLEQITDLKVINDVCERAIKIQSEAVKQYRSGKLKAFSAIVGEVANLSDRRANMKLVVKHLEKLLKR